MREYFELVNLEIPCVFFLKDGSRYDLRTGFPKNTPEVYKTGLYCLGLKPGAEELFKKELVPDLILLIAKARRVQDVEILALAKPKNQAVQNWAAARIKELSTNL